MRESGLLQHMIHVQSNDSTIVETEMNEVVCF